MRDDLVYCYAGASTFVLILLFNYFVNANNWSDHMHFSFHDIRTPFSIWIVQCKCPWVWVLDVLRLTGFYSLGTPRFLSFSFTCNPCAAFNLVESLTTFLITFYFCDLGFGCDIWIWSLNFTDFPDLLYSTDASGQGKEILVSSDWDGVNLIKDTSERSLSKTVPFTMLDLQTWAIWLFL